MTENRCNICGIKCEGVFYVRFIGTEKIFFCKNCYENIIDREE